MSQLTKEAQTIFRAYDVNGDGLLTKNDIGQILRDLGEHPEPSDIITAIMECDVDQDGFLSAKEFRNYYEKISAKYHGECYNRLLIGDRIGRVRRSAYTLPPSTFVYGKPSGSDPEGVGDLLSYWDVFDQKKNHVAEPDYIPMNIHANDDGCVKAPEYRAHHLAHTIYKQYQEIIPRSNKPEIPKKYRENRFGQLGRPSTPIKMLLTNEFAGPQEERDYPMIPRRDEAKIIPRARQTIASKSRYRLTKKKLEPPEDTTKLWKMTKFREVESRTAPIYKSPKNTLTKTASNTLQRTGSATQKPEEEEEEGPRIVMAE